MTEQSTESPSASSSSRKRVLIVDDEEIVRRLAEAMLKRLGYDVQSARSANDALQIFQAEPFGFDLVVLDMIMPGMDGAECYAEMKKFNPGVRAILSSGYGQEGAAQDALDHGVRGFVQKPYRLEELSRVVAAALDS